MSAAVGMFILALVSSEATAQSRPAVTPAVQAVAQRAATPVASSPAPTTATLTQRAVQTVTVTLPAAVAAHPVAAAIAKEASWLMKNGWPLYALVDRFGAGDALDEESNCIATAVYFEARGESLEGQLAVARVIMNRAASGRYPTSWCGVVKQPWQFSFVQRGRFPSVDTGSASWRKAQAITRLALSNAVPSLSSDVLWYHADYVAPSWGRRLTRVEKIGTHIFYRA